MHTYIRTCWVGVIFGSLSPDAGFVTSLTLPDPTPPTFPSSFSISFHEVLVLGGHVIGSNEGTWYYDYDNRQARFDHDEGQHNNICQGQDLSPDDISGNCSLLFTPTEDLCVSYPIPGTCCRLCGKPRGDSTSK